MTGVPIRVSTTPLCKDFTGLWRFCGSLDYQSWNQAIKLRFYIYAGVVGSIIADNFSYTDIIALQTVVDQRNFLF